jgi:hypothetical protein
MNRRKKMIRGEKKEEEEKMPNQSKGRIVNNM